MADQDAKKRLRENVWLSDNDIKQWIKGRTSIEQLANERGVTKQRIKTVLVKYAGQHDANIRLSQDEMREVVDGHMALRQLAVELDTSVTFLRNYIEDHLDIRVEPDELDQLNQHEITFRELAKAKQIKPFRLQEHLINRNVKETRIVANMTFMDTKDIEMYIDDQMSSEEIGAKYGKTRQFISKTLKKNGFSAIREARQAEIQAQIEHKIETYYKKGYQGSELAKKVGISASKLNYMLAQLKKKKLIEPTYNRHTNAEWAEIIKDFNESKLTKGAYCAAHDDVSLNGLSKALLRLSGAKNEKEAFERLKISPRKKRTHKRNDIDWNKLKKELIDDGESIMEIQKRYSVGPKTVINELGNGEVEFISQLRDYYKNPNKYKKNTKYKK